MEYVGGHGLCTSVACAPRDPVDGPRWAERAGVPGRPRTVLPRRALGLALLQRGRRYEHVLARYRFCKRRRDRASLAEGGGAQLRLARNEQRHVRPGLRGRRGWLQGGLG